MKKFKQIFLLSIMVLSLGACETVDFGDTNENRNGPSEFDSAALLTAAQRRYVTIGFRDWLVNPHLYVQYQAQPVYQDESRYAEGATNWSAYYSQTLMNLQQVINLSNDPEVTESPAYLSNGSPNNQIGIARIMKVIIFKRLTDTYGDIPYFEALNPEIQSPAYTSQEDIYMDFINELKEARDMLEPEEAEAVGDIIYDGDVASWRRFANSLLLSITMQMSEAAPSVAATEFAAALNNEHGVIETTDQEAWYYPVNVSTLVNPWTAFRPADYNMSEYFQNAFQGDEEDYSNDTYDARLDIYSTAPEAEGLPFGREDYTGISSDAQISLYITSPTTPFPLLTSSYTYLNRAEAAERGWTEEDAEEMLRQGIIQSYASSSEYFGNGPHIADNGLDPIDITDEAEGFADARVSDASSAGMMQVIAEEKWAALFPDGFQAWAEWRRTGIPELTPSPDALNNGEIPRRYLYPNTEINLNNANYQSGVSSLNPASDNNTSRVWWDQ